MKQVILSNKFWINVIQSRKALYRNVKFVLMHNYILFYIIIVYLIFIDIHKKGNDHFMETNRYSFIDAVYYIVGIQTKFYFISFYFSKTILCHCIILL